MAVTESIGTVIVGGGITGLAAAERLTRAGAPFLLLEADTRLGGKIVTERTRGYVIEGGPDSFLAAKPGGLALIRQLGMEPRLRGTDPAHRRSYIKRRGRLYPLPEGLTGLVPSRLLPLATTRVLSLMGRLRAALETVIPGRPGDDESIARFVTRRFGREAYDWLVEPLLSGIYAGDGEALSLLSTFPQLAMIERTHGSILRAMLRRHDNPATLGTSPTGFVAPAGGLGEIVEKLAARLPASSLRLGTAVAAIEADGTAYRIGLAAGGSLTADHVILATPAYASAAMARSLDADLARELDAIPFISTATVSLVFPVAAIGRGFDGYGYVSPRAAGGPVVACTWTSNKFPERVPAGGVLIRFFIGRAGHEDVVQLSDSDLETIARRELEQVFGLRATPALVRVFRWPRAMPQYVVGHGARLERIDRLVAGHPGLILAGASYRGVGIPDCVSSGWSAADRLLHTAGVAA